MPKHAFLLFDCFFLNKEVVLKGKKMGKKNPASMC